LQYQIKRCTAPCVNHIAAEEYQKDVAMTIKLLEGKEQEVLKNLAIEMEEAATALNYELAAKLRDQLATLKMTGDRGTTMSEADNCDYVAAMTLGGQSCVQVFHIRNGVTWVTMRFIRQHPREVHRGIFLTRLSHSFTSNTKCLVR